MQPSDYALGPVSTSALTSLRGSFQAMGHKPGTQHRPPWRLSWTRCRPWQKTGLKSKVYVSSLDPGVGKTQSVVHFARALVASPAHRDVGMLILVGRVQEAEALANALGSDLKPSLAVWTAETAINEKWSGTTPEQAQVLITTQQRVERAVQGKPFGAISSLHFQGRARTVRVWDEAWLPGVPVARRRDDLLGLVAPLRVPFPGLANAVEDFAEHLRKLTQGATVQVPDFEAKAGISAYALIDTPGVRFTDDQQSTIRDLFAAGGTTVRAWKDDLHGISLVTYTDLWPADFTPILVLDASGRVRGTYPAMAKYRDNLKILPTRQKTTGR